MKTGVVRSIVTKKAFGFIRTELMEEFFFHKDDFHGHWEDLINDFDNEVKITVQFEEEKTPKGLRARSVTRLDNGVLR